MANRLMYIPNADTQNYPYCRLKLVVKTFEHPTKRTNQSKCNKGKEEVKSTHKKTLL